MPAVRSRRFLNLLVEHFPTRLESILHARDISKEPVVVLRSWDECVLDASPLAMTQGVQRGDSRRRVQQLCPKAILLPARDAVYQSHHDSLQAILSQFAKAVEVTALGDWVIEVSDLACAYPSEKDLALFLVAKIDQTILLTPTIGIAGNKFTAARAARQAQEQNRRVVVVPPDKERHFLAPLPLTVLPNPPAELLRRLAMYDITTLGEFAEFRHVDVIEQFGSEVVVLHDLARGIDLRPLVPFTLPPSLVKTVEFDHPVKDSSILLNNLERVAAEFSVELTARDHYTAALSALVRTADGVEHRLGTSLKSASADEKDLKLAVGRLVIDLKVKAAVVGFTLTAFPLRDWTQVAEQPSLFDARFLDKFLDQREQAKKAAHKVQLKFGEALLRLAATLDPPLPIPIEVEISEAGVPVRLTWNDLSRKVTCIEKKWRDRHSWWRPGQLIRRRYYQVEAREGQVYVVFQDQAGHWYLDRRRVFGEHVYRPS